jgi:hypothetical protein
VEAPRSGGVPPDTPKQKEKGKGQNNEDVRAAIRARGERDESVTVVCSRYEKRKGRPSSLIRTCQEPGARCPTKERSGGIGVEG